MAETMNCAETDDPIVGDNELFVNYSNGEGSIHPSTFILSLCCVLLWPAKKHKQMMEYEEDHVLSPSKRLLLKCSGSGG